MDNPNTYGQDWSLEHIIDFNGIVIDENQSIFQLLNYGIYCNNLNVFNQDWSLQHMIDFNRNLIDEFEVTCQWVDQGICCNDPVKCKDLKAHLYLRHGITSDSEPYSCLWHGCIGSPMKKSSIERHVKEQHVPVKWACPYCEETFSRERTLWGHIQRTPDTHSFPL